MIARISALVLALAALLVGLPLLGVALAGRDLAPYLEFPPVTRPVAHAPFSWGAFGLIAALVIATVAPLAARALAAPQAPRAAARHPIPWWGWFGLALLASSWVFAWNRFAWFAPFQPYTFTPIWLGYVLVVNALTHRRTGRCMLTARPAYLLALFPLSGAFWWFFEFLNRFVHNWHYVGVPGLGSWEYFWQATLPFSTVLPAVLGTRDWLASFPRVDGTLGRAWVVRPRAPRALAAATLVAAALPLAAIGIWPQFLFPLVWVSPLLVLCALQALLGQRTIFTSLARGDWRDLWRAALAALVCGFFWELWNFGSLAHWEYSVPFVHRFEVFHMPVLGYAGYLPFGLACIAVAALLDDVARSDAGTHTTTSRREDSAPPGASAR